MTAKSSTRLFLFICAAASLLADVRLPAIISDHMLLERRMPVRIWGWADPGESVSVFFRGQKVAGEEITNGRKISDRLGRAQRPRALYVFDRMFFHRVFHLK